VDVTSPAFPQPVAKGLLRGVPQPLPMKIVKRTMGWIQKPSTWQYQQSLNARRRAQAQVNLNQQSVLAGAIFATKNTTSDEKTALVLKSAVSRIAAAAEERVKSALSDDLLGKLDKSA
jgi:hypothetical protein